ncbi:asparaginase [Alicyclobacillus mengziensis]|uniref:Asparaginase n=1 Tax=Alicyclobacillus mengziensis TaxID=2931921 RepID=A0A9X7W366_9BACL|nr:asparaginase [Alicyclobacillus mengziensis]QSO49362.1 asparaginase [Alicyclobacillus mengziensis]
MKTRLRLLACGGTISAEASDNGFALPKRSGEDLLAQLPKTEVSEITVENFSKVLSSQFTVDQVHQLALRIRNIMSEDPLLTGIVVTHGTGAMEENAFMADLLYADERPVVFTGAMRSASDPFWDGAMNLVNAIRVASSPLSKNRGVLVAMNGTIHAASDVTKTHTTAVDTFDSGEFGPLGYVYPDGIYYARDQLHRMRFPELTAIEPKVDLIKFVVGMDDRFIRTSVESGAKGIVIEGSGLGNLNDSLIQGVRYALLQSVKVVVCSRSPKGRVYPAYGTNTGAEALRKMGCILASMPGPKVRMLLMVLLGLTQERDELQQIIDPFISI